MSWNGDKGHLNRIRSWHVVCLQNDSIISIDQSTISFYCWWWNIRLHLLSPWIYKRFDLILSYRQSMTVGVEVLAPCPIIRCSNHCQQSSFSGSRSRSRSNVGGGYCWCDECIISNLTWFIRTSIVLVMLFILLIGLFILIQWNERVLFCVVVGCPQFAQLSSSFRVSRATTIWPQL